MKSRIQSSGEILDQAPPHDLECEMGVIGSVLLNQAQLGVVEGIVRPADFYDPRNGIIYQAMIDLKSASTGIDVTTLRAELKRRGDFDAAGGAAYIAELIQSVGISDNAVYYARQVEALKQKRKFRRLAENMLAATANGQTPGEMFLSTEGALADIKRSPSAKGRAAVSTCLASVSPATVNWLWPGRVPLGKLTLLFGDPGLGKSMVSHDLTSRVSTGAAWPDDPTTRAPRGGVVLLTAEDSLDDTVRPRLDAAGADVFNVVAFEAVQAEQRLAVNLQRDTALLEEVIERQGNTKMVVIDPISAYLGRVDAHSNSEVRALLHVLSDLAQRRGVAVFAITHLNKRRGGSALYRAMGSLAFVAAARAAWLVARDPHDARRRLFLPAKNNLAGDSTGLAFSIVDGIVRWERDPVSIAADVALAPPEEESKPGPDQSARKQAVKWLRELLSTGPLPAAVIRQEADDAGVAWRTLHRAKDDLGITPYRTQFQGAWLWELPTDDACQADTGNHNLASWHGRRNHEENADS